MPTTLPTTSPYAALTASQVLARQAELLARWAQEDAERKARHAAILAAL